MLRKCSETKRFCRSRSSRPGSMTSLMCLQTVSTGPTKDDAETRKTWNLKRHGGRFPVFYRAGMLGGAGNRGRGRHNRADASLRDARARHASAPTTAGTVPVAPLFSHLRRPPFVRELKGPLHFCRATRGGRLVGKARL